MLPVLNNLFLTLAVLISYYFCLKLFSKKLNKIKILYRLNLFYLVHLLLLSLLVLNLVGHQGVMKEYSYKVLAVALLTTFIIKKKRAVEKL